jgi:peptidyl-tRNA hydrolase, PTH1 family
VVKLASIYNASVFWRRKPASELAFIVFGLGNPGPDYALTRHNAGWWALDALARQAGVTRTEHRHRGQADFVKLAGQQVALIKPTTFMNLSGQCVGAWLREHPQARFAVVHDDIDLAAGSLRLRAQGSAGGHKGVKSIIQILGREEFDRLRIGVGAPPPGEDSADYVLAPPSPREEDEIMSAIKIGVAALELLACGEFNQAQQLAATAGRIPPATSAPGPETQTGR